MGKLDPNGNHMVDMIHLLLVPNMTSREVEVLMAISMVISRQLMNSTNIIPAIRLVMPRTSGKERMRKGSKSNTLKKAISSRQSSQGPAPQQVGSKDIPRIHIQTNEEVPKKKKRHGVVRLMKNIMNNKQESMDTKRRKTQEPVNMNTGRHQHPTPMILRTLTLSRCLTDSNLQGTNPRKRRRCTQSTNQVKTQTSIT